MTSTENIPEINSIKTVVDTTRQRIIDQLEQSCKNYITEKNITLNDWKKYGTMDVFKDKNDTSPFIYTAGVIKYKDDVIIKFGKDPTNDLAFLISESWRK